MKRIVCLIGLVVILVSCVSTSGIYRQLMPEEQSQYTILRSVQVEIEITHFANNKDNGFQQAYALLLREASKKYEGNIDVRDITLTKFDNGHLDIIDADYMAIGKVVIPIVK